MCARQLTLRAKSFLLTWPQVGQTQPEIIHQQLLDRIGDAHIKYLCVSVEKHQDGGRHFHAFLMLNERRQVAANEVFDIQLANNRLHGNYQACRNPKVSLQYVMKEGEYKEYGETPFQITLDKKAKNKLILANNLQALVDDGIISVQNVNTILKGKTFLQNEIRREKPKEAPIVYWFYGPTGSGKTRKAIQMAGDDYWISHDNLKWFDGYTGQRVAIIDDFRTADCSFNFLLRLLDRYKLDVPVKGAYTYWDPKTIIITTPRSIDDTFKNHETGEVYEDIEQVKRRVHREVEFPMNEEELTEDIRE